MKKFLLYMLIAALSFSTAFAEEGMWLPSLIGKSKIKQMQKLGLKLSAEDLYSVNNSSLKDVIVNFGGCTAEIISPEGLILTNHHCGYGQIQSHSSIEHDYLTNGFWAMKRSEELPCNGLKVSLLIRMDEVTAEMLKGVTTTMSSEQRAETIKENKAKIIAAATKDNGCMASIESMYYSNQYFIFVYEQFSDVRLVGAPPSAIGKFGGDTDNWMWPRHTGDFSIFRIYADKNNRPAKYSADNIPYKAKRSLTISTKGVKPGDFTMVYGYPGRTQEYITSDAVDYIAQKGDPNKIKLRTLRLDVMNSYQSQDPKVRIMYAAKNASCSNAWKKWQGEVRGIRRMNVVADKKAYEERFTTWAADKPQYKELLPTFEKLYKRLEPYQLASDYYTEAFQPIEITRFANQLYKNDNKELRKENVANFYKNYYLPIDKKTALALLNEFEKNVDKKFQPELLINSSSNIAALVDNIYTNSIFIDKSNVDALLELSDAEIKAKIATDPAYILSKAFNDFFDNNITDTLLTINKELSSGYTTYMKAIMEMEPDRDFYPDANSTIRIAYGTVEGFKAADAVNYAHQSTLEGIIEKDNPDIYDYNVPQRLRDLHKTKDYGRWGVDGTVPVAFIASNHTTGGNSGSPVLNDKGELIGINFDRCWESTMSDIKYDRDLCRNISVDIRYIMFLIDKFAGASYLQDEMNIK
ncbi:MAG: S46 family peptidase [Rikenellaceae bacterium]